MLLAWGNKVSLTFCQWVLWIQQDLGLDASGLMACMAWESARTFSANVMNTTTHAIGLIQFMPSTAAAMGTSTEALGAMTPEDQLHYVWQYFAPNRGRLNNLGDIYMAILWPGGIGKPDSTVLFGRNGPYPVQYAQNQGLDVNHDGNITRADAIQRVQQHFQMGMQPGFRRDMALANIA